VAALLASVLVACSAGGSATVSAPAAAPTTASTAPPRTQPPPTRPPINSIQDCSPIPQAVGQAEPGPREDVGPVALFYEEAVPEAVRARVGEGIRAAQQYLTETLGGFRFDEPVCFDIRAGGGRSSTVGVVYGANHVVVYAGSRALVGSPPWLLAHVAAHEYVHFWQKDIGSPRDGQGPVWLMEGSAELLAYQALVASDSVGYDEARTYSLRRLPPSTMTLQSMERRPPDPEDFSYALAFFASELLTASGGPTSLRTYWRTLSRGMTWEVAFAEAFGVAPVDFYVQFEEQRRRGFPR
jgi:hypothetical protein